MSELPALNNFSPIVDLVARTIYGSKKLYPSPNCSNAIRFLKLTSKKTFDDYDVLVMRELGFSVNITSEVR